MRWATGLALFVLAALTVPGRSCPFCTSSGTTLTQEAAASGLIVYGLPKNARINPQQVGAGSTDLDVEVVIKPHEILGDQKTITLPRYIPQVDPNKPMKYLVFCDVYKGAIDPYRGTPFKADSRIATYLKGALERKDKDVGTRLRFFFDYLDDTDVEISEDAYKEFGNADYKDFRAIAEQFPRDKIRKWLKDPGTPAARLGLYGSMIGHCGTADDAKLLQQLAEDPNKRYTGGMDGVLAGLTMLAPKDGWKLITSTMADPKKDFLLRYAALRAARFLWDYRPDVVKRDEIAQGASVLLEDKDFSDLIIEDFRKWQAWKFAPRILALLKDEKFNLPIIRRSILRFMLRCPAKECPEAAEFVSQQRAKDAKWVEEVESLLSMESTPVTIAPGK